MPLVPILQRQRQVDLCVIEASRIYRASFSPAGATGTAHLKTPNQNYLAEPACHIQPIFLEEREAKKKKKNQCYVEATYNSFRPII